MPHLGSGLPGPNMHWDYKDQLRQTDLGGGGTAFYIYDASGQRVRKVWEKAPGLVEERIYLGGFEIFRRHNGPIGANTATLERETLHVMDDKQRIALVETRTQGNDPAPPQLIRYQFGNHLGSASLELDDQAQIISYEEYAPFGSSTYQAVRNQTETAKRYRYTGKERDEENGFYYYGFRYYSHCLGRWVSCDPLFKTSNSALYTFTTCNPSTHFDIKGLTDPLDSTVASNTAVANFNDVPPIPLELFLQLTAPIPPPPRFEIDQPSFVQGKPEDMLPSREAKPPGWGELNDPLNIILDTGAPFSPMQNRLLYQTIQMPVAGTAMPSVVALGAAASIGAGYYQLSQGNYEEAKKLFSLGIMFALSARPGFQLKEVRQAYANIGPLQEKLETAIFSGKEMLRKQVTISTAVARTESGRPMTLVSVNAGAGNKVINQIRLLAQREGAIFVEGSEHAEANIYAYARANNLWDLAVDASNRHCLACTAGGEEAGARLLNVSKGQYYYRGTKYGVGNYPSAPSGTPVDPAAQDWIARDPNIPSITIGPVR